MSNVWGTRYRLLREQLERWANGLTSDEPRHQVVLEERTVRLLAAVLMLLRQHQPNRRGQCLFCGPTRWTRRFWRRRRRCTVYGALDQAMGQGIDVVWWKVFEGLGRDVNLEDVRKWMKVRASDMPEND
ncbi:MAG: hypothetical protein LC808_19750 [Actinobacteria bacterium]|nr:hypothetical protein [Actinomycetota bacterium]